MNFHYILDDQGNPVHEPDFIKWGRWFEANIDKRHVGETFFGDIRVSTVFLSMNHALFDEKPILYETMVFAPDAILQRIIALSEYDDRSIFAKFLGQVDIQKRYATKDEALEGHKLMCNFIRVCLANGALADVTIVDEAHQYQEEQ